MSTSILVVGTGPVGLTLTSLLSRTLPTIPITLLSPTYPLPTWKGGDKEDVDVRTYAVTPGNLDVMKAAGMDDVRKGVYTNMQVWDRRNPSYVKFNGDKGEPLGYVVEDKLICRSIMDNMNGNVEIIHDSVVQSITHTSNTSSSLTYKNLKTSSTTTVNPTLILSCDGGQSPIRRMLNIPTFTYTYGQLAACATVQTTDASGAHDTAYQRFLDTGPVAMLPLWDGMYNIVWTNTTENVKRMKELGGEEFVKSLHSNIMKGPESVGSPSVIQSIVDGLGLVNMNEFHLPSSSSRFTVPPPPTACLSPVLSFPLSTHKASRYVDNNVVLVGDAAHGVHPMAGQGLNLGLGDVRELVERIGESLEVGEGIGGRMGLERYERNRMMANGITMAGIHGIKQTFDFQGPMGVGGIGRAIGMTGVNVVPGVKKKIIQAAMGL